MAWKVDCLSTLRGYPPQDGSPPEDYKELMGIWAVAPETDFVQTFEEIYRSKEGNLVESLEGLNPGERQQFWYKETTSRSKVFQAICLNDVQSRAIKMIEEAAKCKLNTWVDWSCDLIEGQPIWGVDLLDLWQGGTDTVKQKIENASKVWEWFLLKDFAIVVQNERDTGRYLTVEFERIKSIAVNCIREHFKYWQALMEVSSDNVARMADAENTAHNLVKTLHELSFSIPEKISREEAKSAPHYLFEIYQEQVKCFTEQSIWSHFSLTATASLKKICLAILDPYDNHYDREILVARLPGEVSCTIPLQMDRITVEGLQKWYRLLGIFRPYIPQKKDSAEELAVATTLSLRPEFKDFVQAIKTRDATRAAVPKGESG